MIAKQRGGAMGDAADSKYRTAHPGAQNARILTENSAPSRRSAPGGRSPLDALEQRNTGDDRSQALVLATDVHRLALDRGFGYVVRDASEILARLHAR